MSGSPLPIQFGTSEQFAVLREFLEQAGYTTAGVCQRVGVPTVYDFISLRQGRTVGGDTETPLDLLIRLFMDAELVDPAVVRSFVPDPVRETMERLGLLRIHEPGGPRCYSTVLLYPTESLYIVSDLNCNSTESEATAMQADWVYAATTKGAQDFLSVLPDTPCEAFLELCAGSGIAALIASRFAEHAWANDITERATLFARFNALLNDIPNVTAVQGDLYESVGEQTFDRIVAHPPYVASFEQKFIYRDGGADGEQITRGIVSGLPRYLRPGGRCYCTCVVTDRRGAPVEHRLREMLGDAEGEFDIAVATRRSVEPSSYFSREAETGRLEFGDLKRRHELFEQLGIEQMVYCSFVIERAPNPRKVFTVRRQVGPATKAAQLEWLLSWEEMSTRPDASRILADEKPRTSPETQFRVVHRLNEGRWVPVTCFLATSIPFVAESECPPWAGVFLARCDGTKTVREHLEWLKAEGLAPADVVEEVFVELVSALIASGFLEIPRCPLPAPRAEVKGAGATT